jgi:hypothetical protein
VGTAIPSRLGIAIGVAASLANREEADSYLNIKIQIFMHPGVPLMREGLPQLV